MSGVGSPNPRGAAPGPVSPSPWEDAYLRFETPDEEIRKFQRRLRTLGADRWPKHWSISELFCGRGSGLLALHGLGFTNVDGIDRSPALIARYPYPGRLVIADCRHLPYESSTRDILIVQGGLHHLEELPADLELVSREARRVLRPGGLFVVVEPWLTPFLTFVHLVSATSVVRRLSPKVDAFATMTEYERETYERWLSVPDLVLEVLERDFEPTYLRTRWGKVNFVGRKR
jgi:SAM-dependent methyltransferase